MQQLATPLFFALLLAGCAGPSRDWPSLSPRAGEISPMVPRNVPGAGRCPRGDGGQCVPPPETVAQAAAAPGAAALPAPGAPPSLQAAAAELAALETIAAQVESAAAPARIARDAARVAASGKAGDSAAASRREAAQSSLSAALAPLASADYRRAALAESLREVPAAAALLPRLDALARRIAALQDQ